MIQTLIRKNQNLIQNLTSVSQNLYENFIFTIQNLDLNFNHEKKTLIQTLIFNIQNIDPNYNNPFNIIKFGWFRLNLTYVLFTSFILPIFHQLAFRLLCFDGNPVDQFPSFQKNSQCSIHPSSPVLKFYKEHKPKRFLCKISFKNVIVKNI